MTSFKDISTAPRDRTVIRVRTVGGLELDVSWFNGLVNDNGEECGAWLSENVGDQPECWTDGICWEINEDGDPSDRPVSWRPA